MQIGIFGGTFNPPHLAHLIIADWVREACALDEVWWIPTGNPPHKATQTPALVRLEMTRLATASNPVFKVLSLEAEREGYAYTIDTLSQLEQQYPQHRFHLIIGGDSLRDFQKWKSPMEILQKVPLICYQRPNTDISTVDESVIAKTTFVDAPLIDISSTTLRERISKGNSVRYWVQDAVLAYYLNHLYPSPHDFSR